MTEYRIPDELRELSRTVNRLLDLRDLWIAEDEKARARVADPKQHLDLWAAEAIMDAAATQGSRRELAALEERLADAMVVEGETGNREVVEITDPEKVETFLGHLRKQNTESYMRWYLPNSTSNASVEISLREHKATQTLLAVLNGDRFF